MDLKECVVLNMDTYRDKLEVARKSGDWGQLESVTNRMRCSGIWTDLSRELSKEGALVEGIERILKESNKIVVDLEQARSEHNWQAIERLETRLKSLTDYIKETLE